MRYNFTSAFSEAQAEYAAALEQYNAFDPDAPDEDELEKSAWKRLDPATNAFFHADAYTPAEFMAKLDAAEKRAGDDFDVAAFYTLDAQRLDLGRMHRLEPSPGIYTMFLQFSSWHEEFSSTKACGSASEDDISEGLSAAYRTLMEAACTTPGDFVLKAYVRLLTTHGPCMRAEWRDEQTANPWDVDIDDDEGEATFETIDKKACYADIDYTDVGANLLAYGLPHFDAVAWLGAADRIGMRVDLWIAPDGKRSVGTTMDLLYDRDSDLRLRREKDRLMRLHGFDSGRTKLIGDEIERNWPHLVYHVPEGLVA